MKLKYSLAVQLLCGLTTGLNIKNFQGLGDQAVSSTYKASEFMMEPNRFINSKGEPIILAQATGHARIELRNEIVNLADEDSQAGSCATTDHEHHCPIATKETELKVFQRNLNNNIYISDIYVGNPPQKLRAIYDTGSTNTWVLNKNTPVKNNGRKMYSYDETKSCSF